MDTYYYLIKIKFHGGKFIEAVRTWNYPYIDTLHSAIDKWARLKYVYNLHCVECVMIPSTHPIIHSLTLRRKQIKAIDLSAIT